MTNPLQTAHNRATAAIDALAREGERMANEHAFALDQLRQECESLRRQNAALRERAIERIHADPVIVTMHRDGVYQITASIVDVDGKAYLRMEVTLVALPDVAPVDTDAP